MLLPFVMLTSCKDEIKETVTYKTQVPVYLSIKDIRAQSITVVKSQPVTSPGKIYIYGDYLFVNEQNKGIHIIDNSNPALPKILNFINIPGNVDMAVNDNILYADHYIDLLAIDISDPKNVKVVKTVEGVFESNLIDKVNGIFMTFKDTVITTTVNSDGFPMILTRGNMFDSSPSSLASNSKGYGTGGSTARFTLMNENLYTVDNATLKLFNVTSPSAPSYVKTINIGWGLETIFPYKNKLFIGSRTGMHIYDASIPANPVKLSTYNHITSCDPVVADDKFAYVTLRSGTFCRNGVNVLDIINIEDLSNPKLVSSFPMLNPHGLALFNSNLFICEGTNGLKSFQVNEGSNPVNINQLGFVKDFDAQDVIVGPKSLIVTGSLGIQQFDYSNPAALNKLSQINLTNQ
jgi:hypothetical protein